MWKDPKTLLTSQRFDILFKYLYVKLKDKSISEPWVDKIYSHHIDVWNGLKEIKPKKVGIEQYKNTFHEIINSIKLEGFDSEKSYIPISKENGNALNGAHRIAASIFYNKDVFCKEAENSEGQLCPYSYLLHRDTHVPGGLNLSLADLAAQEYCNLKENTYIVSLFPSAVGKDPFVYHFLQNNTDLIYHKYVQLTNYGPFNYVRLIYDEDASRGNPWLGNWQNGYAGAQSKTSHCFANPFPMRVFLIQEEDESKVRFLKEEIRKIYGIGNHSVHINDTRSETLKISRYVFNKNSIHFLNNSRPIFLRRFENFFNMLTTWVENSEVALEDLCVDSSAVLAAYGLRDCRDIDFLYYKDHIETNNPDVSCHNEEMKYYQHKKNDIIFNPENHFYYKGVKFASLEVVMAMKKFRNEEKDKVDIELIKSVL